MAFIIYSYKFQEDKKSNEKPDKSGERFRGVFYHVSLFEIMSKFTNSKKC